MTDEAILNRLRRKIEIVRLDSKHRNDAVHHDMNEMLTLLDMLEREIAKGKNNGTA